VRSFADGRIFTGEQALALGVVDRLGSEEEARRWTAELAGLDPEKAECITLGEKKGGLRRLIPGNSEGQSATIHPALAAAGLSPRTVSATLDWIAFEQSTSGLPLWLYRP
jgi:protease-4